MDIGRNVGIELDGHGFVYRAAQLQFVWIIHKRMYACICSVQIPTSVGYNTMLCRLYKVWEVGICTHAVTVTSPSYTIPHFRINEFVAKFTLHQTIELSIILYKRDATR